jgi:uncharacterized membrane protein YvlD (DUF360 family)
MKLPKLPSSEKLLRVACVLGLIALPLMVWSIFDPTVWPVLVALSLGQAIGTLSFGLFLVVVARDLAVARKLRRDSLTPPPPSSRDVL